MLSSALAPRAYISWRTTHSFLPAVRACTRIGTRYRDCLHSMDVCLAQPRRFRGYMDLLKDRVRPKQFLDRNRDLRISRPTRSRCFRLTLPASGHRTTTRRASATLSNLRMGMGAPHVGRAVLEGVAFSIADCQDALLEAGAPIERIVLIGGGARSRFWAQIIANAIGRPLAIPSNAALGPALGAARLARQAIGHGLIPEAEDGLEAAVVSPDPAARESLGVEA